jgi:hypothetical protein
MTFAIGWDFAKILHRPINIGDGRYAVPSPEATSTSAALAPNAGSFPSAAQIARAGRAQIQALVIDRGTAGWLLRRNGVNPSLAPKVGFPLNSPVPAPAGKVA